MFALAISSVSQHSTAYLFFNLSAGFTFLGLAMSPEALFDQIKLVGLRIEGSIVYGLGAIFTFIGKFCLLMTVLIWLVEHIR